MGIKRIGDDFLELLERIIGELLSIIGSSLKQSAIILWSIFWYYWEPLQQHWCHFVVFNYTDVCKHCSSIPYKMTFSLQSDGCLVECTVCSSRASEVFWIWSASFVSCNCKASILLARSHTAFSISLWSEANCPRSCCRILTEESGWPDVSSNYLWYFWNELPSYSLYTQLLMEERESYISNSGVKIQLKYTREKTHQNRLQSMAGDVSFCVGSLESLDGYCFIVMVWARVDNRGRVPLYIINSWYEVNLLLCTFKRRGNVEKEAWVSRIDSKVAQLLCCDCTLFLAAL